MSERLQLDDCNRRGQTALMMAAACGNLQVVRLLLEQGASVDRADSRDRQALHYASSCSQNVVVDALLQAGADPNAADSDGMTPLLEACASGHELTTCSLLEYLTERAGLLQQGIDGGIVKIWDIWMEYAGEDRGVTSEPPP
ncbi:ankyrin repeat protein [Ancylostoma duodenale]|uniref:Ankyrin repeat protein n=1 Tax=Ancylostoma duodenale TaxID=51022 RepID=A0A0C2FXT2_9BILA|nr:ankyrin repeat protein [Ancylostoma duodenale]